MFSLSHQNRLSIPTLMFIPFGSSILNSYMLTILYEFFVLKPLC